MAEPWEYWGTAQKIQRKNKAPEILKSLIADTNLDTDTINEMMKGYLDTGEMKAPKFLPEGQQGPLEEGQRRETPTNSLRQPAYVYDEESKTFGRAPEGVSDPIRQIRELGRFRYDSDKPTGNWFKDENGRWQRWTAPDKPPKPRPPTAAEQKERLAIEAVTSALRQKIKVNPLTKMTEPIVDKEDALGVVVSAGLDVNRYPEIQQLIQGYEVAPAPAPEGPSFFDRLGGMATKAATSVAKGTGSVVGAGINAAKQFRAAPAGTGPAPADVQEVERRTKDGKIAIFDAKTKKFLRWK